MLGRLGGGALSRQLAQRARAAAALNQSAGGASPATQSAQHDVVAPSSTVRSDYSTTSGSFGPARPTAPAELHALAPTQPSSLARSPVVSVSRAFASSSVDDWLPLHPNTISARRRPGSHSGSDAGTAFDEIPVDSAHIRAPARPSAPVLCSPAQKLQQHQQHQRQQQQQPQQQQQQQQRPQTRPASSSSTAATARPAAAATTATAAARVVHPAAARAAARRAAAAARAAAPAAPLRRPSASAFAPASPATEADRITSSSALAGALDSVAALLHEYISALHAPALAPAPPATLGGLTSAAVDPATSAAGPVLTSARLEALMLASVRSGDYAAAWRYFQLHGPVTGYLDGAEAHGQWAGWAAGQPPRAVGHARALPLSVPPAAVAPAVHATTSSRLPPQLQQKPKQVSGFAALEAIASGAAAAAAAAATTTTTTTTTASAATVAEAPDRSWQGVARALASSTLGSGAGTYTPSPSTGPDASAGAGAGVSGALALADGIDPLHSLSGILFARAVATRAQAPPAHAARPSLSLSQVLAPHKHGQTPYRSTGTGVDGVSGGVLSGLGKPTAGSLSALPAHLAPPLPTVGAYHAALFAASMLGRPDLCLALLRLMGVHEDLQRPAYNTIGVSRETDTIPTSTVAAVVPPSGDGVSGDWSSLAVSNFGFTDLLVTAGKHQSLARNGSHVLRRSWAQFEAAITDSSKWYSAAAPTTPSLQLMEQQQLSMGPRGAAYALTLMAARLAGDPTATLAALELLCAPNTGRFLASQRLFGMALQNLVLADAWELLPRLLSVMAARRTHPNKVTLTTLMSSALQRRSPLQALAAFDTFFDPPGQRLELVMGSLRVDARDKLVLRAAVEAAQERLTGSAEGDAGDAAAAAAAEVVGALWQQQNGGAGLGGAGAGAGGNNAAGGAGGWFQDPGEAMTQPLISMLSRLRDAEGLAADLAAAAPGAGAGASQASAGMFANSPPPLHTSARARAGDGEGDGYDGLSQAGEVTPESAPFTVLGARLMPQLRDAVRGYYTGAAPSLLSATAGVTGPVAPAALEHEWSRLCGAIARGIEDDARRSAVRTPNTSSSSSSPGTNPGAATASAASAGDGERAGYHYLGNDAEDFGDGDEYGDAVATTTSAAAAPAASHAAGVVAATPWAAAGVWGPTALLPPPPAEAAAGTVATDSSLQQQQQQQPERLNRFASLAAAEDAQYPAPATAAAGSADCDLASLAASAAAPMAPATALAGYGLAGDNDNVASGGDNGEGGGMSAIDAALAALSSDGSGGLLWGAESAGLSARTAAATTAPLLQVQVAAATGPRPETAPLAARTLPFNASAADLVPAYVDPASGLSLPWAPLPAPATAAAPAAEPAWLASVMAAERARADGFATGGDYSAVGAGAADDREIHPVLAGIERARRGEYPLNVFLPTAFTLRCALRACRDTPGGLLWREALALLDLMVRLGLPVDHHAFGPALSACVAAGREAETVALCKLLLSARLPLRASVCAELVAFFAARGSNSDLVWELTLWALQSPAPTQGDAVRRLDTQFVLNLVRTFVLEGFPMRAVALMLALTRTSPKTLSLYSAVTHATANALPRLDEVAGVLLKVMDSRYLREYWARHAEMLGGRAPAVAPVSTVITAADGLGAVRSQYPATGGHFVPIQAQHLLPAWTSVMAGLALYHQPAGLRMAIQIWARRQLVPLTHNIRYLDHISMLIAVARYGSSHLMLLTMASKAKPLLLTDRPSRPTFIQEIPGRTPSPGSVIFHMNLAPRLYLHLLALEALARFLVNVDVPMNNDPYSDRHRLVAREAELGFACNAAHVDAARAAARRDGLASVLASVNAAAEQEQQPLSGEALRAADDTGGAERDRQLASEALARARSHDAGLPQRPESVGECDDAFAEAALLEAAAAAADSAAAVAAASATGAPEPDIKDLYMLWSYVRYTAAGSRYPPTKSQLTSLADQFYDLTVARFGIKSSLVVLTAQELAEAAPTAPLLRAPEDTVVAQLELSPLSVSEGTLPLYSAVRFSRRDHTDLRARFPSAAALADAVVAARPAAITPSLWSAVYKTLTADEDPQTAVMLAAAGRHAVGAPPTAAAALQTLSYVTQSLLDTPASGFVVPRIAADAPSGAPTASIETALALRVLPADARAAAGFSGAGINAGAESHALVLDLRNHSFATGVLALRRALREVIDWGVIKANGAQNAVNAHKAVGRESVATPELPASLVILCYSHYSPAPHTVMSRLFTAADLPLVLTRLGFPRAYMSSPVAADPELRAENAEGGPVCATVIPAAALNQWLYCTLQNSRASVPPLAQDIENHFG